MTCSAYRAPIQHPNPNPIPVATAFESTYYYIVATSLNSIVYLEETTSKFIDNLSYFARYLSRFPCTLVDHANTVGRRPSAMVTVMVG